MSNRSAGDGFYEFFRETKKHMRRHVYLWPVMAFAVIGPCFSIYVGLWKLQGPDVTLTLKGKEPDKADQFENRRYRIYELTPFDYANYKHPRPRF